MEYLPLIASINRFWGDGLLRLMDSLFVDSQSEYMSLADNLAAVDEFSVPAALACSVRYRWPMNSCRHLLLGEFPGLTTARHKVKIRTREQIIALQRNAHYCVVNRMSVNHPVGYRQSKYSPRSAPDGHRICPT